MLSLQANLALKFATDSDMHDGWLMERDAKMPQVILNDKLMTDALLSGGQPIKTEHSYSLKSDGDSMPDSPCSLHDDDKMDDGKCDFLCLLIKAYCNDIYYG